MKKKTQIKSFHFLLKLSEVLFLTAIRCEVFNLFLSKEGKPSKGTSPLSWIVQKIYVILGHQGDIV